MKIAIIGAGAMGCLYASLLAAHSEVTLYDAAPAVVDAINRTGVTCREPDGAEANVRIPAQLTGSGTAPYDLVILFVKDLYSRAALEANRALIGPGTLLLSLQNGMGNEEIMRDFAAPAQILLGTTKHNCVTLAPGQIYHSGSGITFIGSPVGNSAAAETVVGLFVACGFEAEECTGVRHLLWEKLFLNMSVNPVTALLGAHIGTVSEDPDLRELVHAMIDEAVRVAAADGETFDADTVFARLIESTRQLSTGTASMCQDIQQKRRTEIDFINGAVVRIGAQYGIPTPYNSTIVHLMHAKERLVRKQD